MDESENNDNNKNEIFKIHNILKVIYSRAPPIIKDLSNITIDTEYKKFVNEIIDLKTINNKLNNDKYISITDVIKDIRLVLLNCYTFYGAKSDYTIKSLEFEELFENRISQLDNQFKSLAKVELTLNLLNIQRKPNFKFRYPKGCYNSKLLKSVAHCRPDRLNDYHKLLFNTYTTDVDNINTLELTNWENDNFKYNISSMWELPDIGDFISIIFKAYNYDIVYQIEIERMFLMPKESTTMSKIMTILLIPFENTNYIGRNMPYNIWSEKLSKKVSEWYKMYYKIGENKVKIMQLLGIHPDFWTAVGDKNPLVENDYCELSYFIKVWLVKGLCDYVFTKSRAINYIITNCNQRQCTLWKNNFGTEEYFVFNSMPDLRIYYYKIPFDEPNLQFLELKKSDQETKKTNSGISGTSSDIKPLVKPNKDNFKLIADSVQGLRSFLAEIEIDATVPELLIKAFDNLVMKVEPNEYNFINMNNNCKIKLFKDWKSYPERMHKEKEEILFWKQKDPKNLANINEDILKKRKRKPILKEELYNIYDSDEYYSSDFEKIPSDHTDSEDEWGAIYQKKNKIKRSTKSSKKVNKKINISIDDSIKNVDEIDKLMNCSKINDHSNHTKHKPIESISKNEFIDAKDDIHVISIKKIKQSPIDMLKMILLNPNNYLDKSNTTVSEKRQVASTSALKQYTNTSKRSTIISPNITILPGNINLPKEIQITKVYNQQTDSFFNSSKSSTSRTNDCEVNITSVVNVKCKVISKRDFNGEVGYYVSLPNGKFHPVPDEPISMYLKEHNNQLPEYWLVPLPMEVAEKYGYKY